jgi:serine phosphatase RsbU (regulator of sigma subunit)
MNLWSRTVDGLIFHKDKQDPESVMRGKFFVGSTLFFFFFVIASIPYFIFLLPEELQEHPEMFYANLIFSPLILLTLYLYKRFGWRIILVNIITVLGFTSNIGTYENGGIYSPDNMWGIIISAWVFLVADRKSGYFWMILSLATITYFNYAEGAGDNDFLNDVSKLDADYYYINYLMGGIFLLIIISLYETSKRKFVKDLKSSKAELEIKGKELETQKEDIISSINYAKRIQYAVLPHEDSIYRSIPLSFILYKPRDIVSGDFFWFHEIDRDNYIIVCADCTGHGVPGAFMTVIGSSALNQIVIENRIHEPAMILSELDNRISTMLKQEKSREGYVHDGMDLSLLKVDKSKKEFTFTSAKRPAIFIRNKELQELKGSKHTLGGLRSDAKQFEELRMKYEEDDMIYLFTDGYIDQFGGADDKKFMIKRFREILLSSSKLPMSEQKQILDKTITSWIGKNEQTDDITVLGIRF